MYSNIAITLSVFAFDLVCGLHLPEDTDFIELAQTSTMTEGPLEDFNRLQLDKHNHYRRLHGVPDLVYDPELAREALNWSAQLARIGGLRHSSRAERRNAGENLAWTSDPD